MALNINDLLWAFYARATGNLGAAANSSEATPYALPNTTYPLVINSVQSDYPNSDGDQNGRGALVQGRWYHGIQIDGTSDGDTYIIEGSIDRIKWYTITDTLGVVMTALAADGIHFFTGLYSYVRARRTSGGGTTTNINLVSRA